MSHSHRGSLLATHRKASSSHLVASVLHLGGLAHTNAHELHAEDTHLEQVKDLQQLSSAQKLDPPLDSIHHDFGLLGPGMKYFGYIAGFLPWPMPYRLRHLGLVYPGFVMLSMISRMVWELQNADNNYQVEKLPIVAIMVLAVGIFVAGISMIVMHGIPQRAVQALHKQTHSFEIFTQIVDNEVAMEEHHHRSLDMRLLGIRQLTNKEAQLFDNKEEIKDMLNGKDLSHLSEDVEVRQSVRKISRSHTLFAVCTLLPVLALQNIPIITEWMDEKAENNSVGLDSVYARLGFLYSNLTLLMSPIYGFTLVTMCMNLFYLRVKNSLEIVDNLAKRRVPLDYLDWVEAMRVAIHHHYKHFKPVVVGGLFLALGLSAVHGVTYMVILFLEKGKYPSVWVFLIPAVVYYLVGTLYAVGHKFVRSQIELDKHIVKLLHRRKESQNARPKKKAVKSSGYGKKSPDSNQDTAKLLDNDQNDGTSPRLEMTGMSKARIDVVNGTPTTPKKRTKKKASSGSRTGRRGSGGGPRKKLSSKKKPQSARRSEQEESVSLADPGQSSSSPKNSKKPSSSTPKSSSKASSSSPKNSSSAKPPSPTSSSTTHMVSHGPTSKSSKDDHHHGDEEVDENGKFVPRASALRLNTFTEHAKTHIVRHPAIGMYWHIVIRAVVLVAVGFAVLVFRLVTEFPRCLEVGRNSFRNWSRVGCGDETKTTLLLFRSFFAMGIPAISPWLSFIFIRPDMWRKKRILIVVVCSYIVAVCAGIYVFLIDEERNDTWPGFVSNVIFFFMSFYLGCEVDWPLERGDHHRWNFTTTFVLSAIGAAAARIVQGAVIIPYYIDASANGKIIVILVLQPVVMFLLAHYFKEMGERIEELPAIEHHHGKATPLLLIPQLLVAFAGRLYLINLKSLTTQLKAACVMGLIEYANRLMAPLEFYIIVLVWTRSRERAWNFSEYVRMNDVHRDSLYVGIITEVMAIILAPLLSMYTLYHFDKPNLSWTKVFLSVAAQLGVEFVTDIAALIMEEAYLGRKIVALFGSLHKRYHYLKVSCIIVTVIAFISGRDYFLLIFFADEKK